MKKILLVLAVSALVLGACGDDDDDATAGGGDGGPAQAADGPLVDAITEAIMADAADDPDMPFSESEIRCFAGSFVGSVGADRLEELGVTPETVADTEFDDFEWTEAELNMAASSLTDCIDVTALLVDSMMQFGVSEEEATCVAEAVPADVFGAIVASGVTGVDDPAAEAALDDVVGQAIVDCGVE